VSRKCWGNRIFKCLEQKTLSSGKNDTRKSSSRQEAIMVLGVVFFEQPRKLWKEACYITTGIAVDGAANSEGSGLQELMQLPG